MGSVGYVWASDGRKEHARGSFCVGLKDVGKTDRDKVMNSEGHAVQKWKM